jgi:hypothetical protein
MIENKDIKYSYDMCFSFKAKVYWYDLWLNFKADVYG